MGKYKNKYRSETIRAPWWDYGKNGYYFVTICIKNRTRHFGSVVNGKMILSDIGLIANNCWLEIPLHFPFVILDAFVIMPDHVHGIVIINKKDGGNDHGLAWTHPVVGTQDFASLRQGASIHDASLPNAYQQHAYQHDAYDPPFNRFGPQSKNLASIIRGFKIGVTKNVHLIAPDFVWQARFHDRIIRNEKTLHAFRMYIKNNPVKWDESDSYF